MTALEQRIQPNHSTRMVTTIKVYADIMPHFKMTKIRYMSRNNITQLTNSDFLENLLMGMSQ
jgi:hypothetical protein